MSGTNVFADYGTATTIETRAQRVAKAQFTTPATTPPWKAAAAAATISSQVSTIQAMKTLIDKPATGTDLLPADVQTTFTAYKALDRLRLLAATAAIPTTSSARRTSLQATFAKGLTDFQAYLAQAPSNQVQLDFALPTRRAESVKIAAPAAFKTVMPGIATARDSAIPGLTGTEQFSIALTKPGASDTVLIDLSQGPQPPTVDSIAASLNAGIKSVPLRNPDGSVVLDSNGQAQPRWLVRFVPDKSSGKWGFRIDAPTGVEQVAITQAGAGDSLMVATAQAAGSPGPTTITRIDDPAGAMNRTTRDTLSAIDRGATARAALLPVTTKAATATGVARPSTDVAAQVDARAIATDPAGFSYVVGTTGGDIGAHLDTGSQDLFLTKLDSEGHTMWQRTLGATGSAQGAAVSIAPDGGVIVAGTVKGSFDGAATDGDMLVARYTAKGDETFATVVRAIGADQANALAVGSDGTIFVGGKNAANQAFVARLDAKGTLAERRIIAGSNSVNALAIDGNGDVLALTDAAGTAQLRRVDGAALTIDLGSVDLGVADGRALAIAPDGSIAVGGATSNMLSGTQANAASGGRDGFVARVGADLSGSSITYLGTSAEDQVDSIAFLGGSLYAGGRTAGALTGTRTGSVDGFVARIDAGSGAVSGITQFGQTALKSAPVRISAAIGGDTVLGALGLHRGALIPDVSARLTTQTSLRAGDEFSIAVGSAAAKKVTIRTDDTLATLATRVRLITGINATVTTLTLGGSATLRIDAKAGSTVEMLAGAPGKDALAKLGMAPRRLSVPVTGGAHDPKVRPGGTFALALSSALNVNSAADAAVAAGKLKAAISTSQTAYRSLYWDDSKAALADGTTATAAGSNPVATAQLANYRAALARLNTTNPLLGF